MDKVSIIKGWLEDYYISKYPNFNKHRCYYVGDDDGSDKYETEIDSEIMDLIQRLEESS
jgi:hypothetical protein